MKHILKKLKSKKGETLAEILIAVLIIALSAGLFATMYTASANINISARKEDEKLFDAVGQLEELMESGGDGMKDGSVHYTPVGEGAGGGNDVKVEVFTQDGLTVYRDGGK